MNHLAISTLLLSSAASVMSAAPSVPSIYLPANAPQPLAPLPTPSQFRWHQQELQVFVHFGINTFNGAEWGDGTEDPKLFAPTALDCEQWARVAKENGFTRMTLSAKHHDGFCLWPSRYTEHSVKASLWREGKGDIVEEFVKACRKYGLGVGIYLSPWDRHDKRYGTPAYNDYYINQVNELFDRYGKIDSFWLDLAFKDEGYRMPFDWQRTYDAMYRRNPAVTIEMGGPDIGWIGNEAGSGLETCWNFTELPYATTSRALPGKMPFAYTGDIQPEAENVGKHPNYKAIPALRYCPKLGDASVRKGWFWNPDQSHGPDWWKNIYYTSVGRGSSMMYGFAPDRRGLFPEDDIDGAVALKKMLDEMWRTDFAAGKPITADNTWESIAGYEAAKALDGDPLSYWSAAEGSISATLEVDLGQPTTFNVINLQEPAFMGQRVKKYRIDYLHVGTWKIFSDGTTIGHRKLDRRARVTATKVRLVIEDARAYPLISTFGVHFTSHEVEAAEKTQTDTREEKAI